MSISEQNLEALASIVAAHLSARAIPDSPQPPASAPADPWQGQAAAPSAASEAPPFPTYVPSAAPQSQGQGASFAQPAAPPLNPGSGQVVPQCQHGPRRFVPAGFSKRNGKPYPAFWGCAAFQDDPTKCASLAA